MIRFPRYLAWVLLLAAISGCAATTKAPDTEARETRPLDERRYRALLLQAEDTRQLNDAVRDGLASEDPEHRRLAVRTLGRLGDPALLAAIDDADASVRAEAVFGAAISGMTEALDSIVARRTDTDADVRGSVALALGLFATPETLSPLTELLADSQPDVRIAASYSAARLSAADSIVSPLSALRLDENPAVADAATYALSRLSGRPEGLSLQQRFAVRRDLILLAEERSPRIRQRVAEGLYKPLEGPQADALAELMKESDERSVLLSILRSTSFPGAPTFVFHEVTIRHADEMIVLATIRGLARMRGPLTNAVLIDFIINDDRNWLQAEAIRALGVADGSTAVEVANGLSNDADPVILAATAEALYGRPEAEAGEYAHRLFESTHPWVRYHAIPTMGCVTEHLTGVFADLVSTSSIEEKIQMTRAAGYRLGMKDRPADDYDDSHKLLSTLWRIGVDREALALQIAVLDAAATGGRPAGAKMLRRGLETVDPGVRRHAASLLQTHYDETVELEPMQPRPIEYYEEIVDWAERRHAAVVTVFRPGYDPGAFTLSLDSKRAPMTAWRFAQLAQQGFYNQRRIEEFIPGLRLHGGRGGQDNYTKTSWRAEPVVSTFPPGTLAATAPNPDALLGEWMIVMDSRPNYLGRYWPFGRVAQFLPGVVGNILPIDRVISVQVYEGTGKEPLTPNR